LADLDYLREFVEREVGSGTKKSGNSWFDQHRFLADLDHLREFVEREVGPGPKKSGKSWFDQHCRFLEENTPFCWANSPVPRDHIEQINLSRNDFVHHSMIGSTWTCQSEKHFRKYPVSAFADKLHLAAMTGEGSKPEFPVPLKVTRENLAAHIHYVRQFCTFVEAQRTKW
jgi:hypothetical protein